MMIKLANADLLEKLDFKHPATWIATWFGAGLIRPAPGTWGTLAAIPFGLLLLLFGGKAALLTGIIAATIAGLWSAHKFEQMSGTHDNSAIVIDEVAGVWITLLATTFSPISIILAFALFRFFDILKPWPISWLDKKIGGAWGVMVDDLVAGIAAALCLWGINTYAFIG